jgi:hypothetical protein
MRPFAEAIAAAMQTEWGATPSARKEIGRITNANERAIRNWFEGKNGPSGKNLVLLIRHSDAVLETVLELSGRRALLPAADVLGLRDRLKEIVDAIDGLSAQQISAAGDRPRAS